MPLLGQSFPEESLSQGQLRLAGVHAWVHGYRAPALKRRWVRWACFGGGCLDEDG